jgi:hypothetical protein
LTKLGLVRDEANDLVMPTGTNSSLPDKSDNNDQNEKKQRHELAIAQPLKAAKLKNSIREVSPMMLSFQVARFLFFLSLRKMIVYSSLIRNIR